MSGKKNQKRTLTEIASIAGVSQPLVSNILNGKGRASDEVRQKVLVLLDESGYKPRIARKPFFHIVPTSNPSGGSWSFPMETMPLQFGMQETFIRQRLVIQQQYANLTDDLSLKEQAEILAAQNPPGIVIESEKSWSKPFLDEFASKKIPVVQVGQVCSDTRFPAVTIDCLGGIRAAVNAMAQRGHRKIAFIRWMLNGGFENSDDKFNGYKLGLEDNGLEFDKKHVAIVSSIPSQQRYEHGAREALLGLLDKEPGITAAIVDNAYISPQVLMPSGDDNGKFPDWLEKLDIGLFADNNSYGQSVYLSRQLCIPLKSVYLISPDWLTVGRLAAQKILSEARNDNKQKGYDYIRVQPKLSLPDVVFS